MITTLGIPVEEALADNGMKSRKVVVNLECDRKSSCVRSLGEVWPTQIVDQWVDWLTNPPSGKDLPKSYWLVAVFLGTNKNDGTPDPDIKSLGQPVKSVKDLLRNIFNLKRSLVFLPTIVHME